MGFFNELMANPKENLQSINPDSKTFTIFLKGIKNILIMKWKNNDQQ